MNKYIIRGLLSLFVFSFVQTALAQVACTMEYRACPDGSAMPRDADCTWREDKCTGGSIPPTVCPMSYPACANDDVNCIANRERCFKNGGQGNSNWYDPNSTTSSTGSASASSCVTIQSPVLQYQSVDGNTGGEVYKLQNFLIKKGFLSTSATGYFGRMTENAVKAYQGSIGVSQVGSVGPITRGIIQRETCAVSAGNSSDQPGIYNNPSTGGNNVGVCNMMARLCPDGSAMPRDADCTWREDKCTGGSIPPTVCPMSYPACANDDVNCIANRERCFGGR